MQGGCYDKNSQEDLDFADFEDFAGKHRLQPCPPVETKGYY
jgi:hypothetical protein